MKHESKRFFLIFKNANIKTFIRLRSSFIVERVRIIILLGFLCIDNWRGLPLYTATILKSYFFGFCLQNCVTG